MKKLLQTRNKVPIRILTGLFLSLLFLQVPAGNLLANDQSDNLTADFREATLSEVFAFVKKNTQYKVLFDKNSVDVQVKVSVTAKSMAIKTFMLDALKGTGYEFEIYGKQILVRPRKVAPATKTQDNTFPVVGTVKDENGEELIGVNVTLKRDPAIGVVTDVEGRFALKVKATDILQFSFVGYKPIAVSVGNRTSFDITLEENLKELEAVVVVGFGTQTKAELSTSVDEVKGEALEKLPVTNINQAIETLVPSLTITGSAQESPGASPSLRIRGESSLNGGSPLVLIDGVQGSLSLIDPADVASYTVLKDASSAAIYGARGSGGVILITTKQGNRNEKFKINYSGSYTVKSPTHLPESLSGQKFAELRGLSEIAAGRKTDFTHPDILAALADPDVTEIPNPRRPTTHFVGTGNTDWIGEVVGSATLQKHNISLSGGTRKAGYWVSAGYTDESSLYEYGDYGFKRYNFRSNLNAEVGDHFRLDAKIGFTHADQDRPVKGYAGALTRAISQHPFNPVKWKTTGDWGGNNGGNAVHDLLEGGSHRSLTNDLNLNISGTLKPFKGFEWVNLAGFRYSHDNNSKEKKTLLRYSVRPGIPIGRENDPNEFIKESKYRFYKNFQSYASYKRVVGRHEAKIMLGASYEDNISDNLSGRRKEFFSNDLVRVLDLGTGEQYNNNSVSDWAIGSYFGRLNYNFAKKYFVEASFRSDASSRFTDDNKWGFFPSASVAWRIIEESFLKDTGFLSDLKIRASWGQVGNQSGIGLYDFVPQLQVGGDYPIGDDYSQNKWVVQNSLASPARSWETIETQNIGIDFGLWKNRLTGSFEYYTKKNKDMLVAVDIPSVIGMNVPTYNSGELETWGWEVSVRWRDRVGELSYSLSATLHDSQNEITKYESSRAIFSGSGRNIEGYPFRSYFGYTTAGLFQSDDEVTNWAKHHSRNAAGDVKFMDIDESGVIDQGDIVYLGNPSPRYNYAINLDVSWRGLDLGLTFDGVGKKDIYISGNKVNPIQYPKWEDHLDYWTPENPNAKYPRLYYNDGWNWKISDRMLWDASFLRLKNVQLGYTFPKNITDILHVSKLRLYANGRNLFVQDDFVPFLDPQSTNVTQYPVLKSVTFGLNITP
ncbi:SusC/RagA family TonB-linked outer membrane protein (plasmid) [Fulvitalea axinellae]|uniref:SusC/RagA family TonB-linked outer membrane protein n=1 Tax=Fulvitalea axinellae TaxID=1182444 RepID=A0AAU9CIB7_9BACT|nr:SusC/RagA family TonB-linked outer membrane protein [Fulvitalea axinellae]